MGIFSKAYSKVLQWSEHKHAPYYLGGLSFIESSIFPIPPEVMLISMGLVKPQQAWNYALIATICSVLGGMLGYFIGACFLQLIYPYIQYIGYAHAYGVAAEWFKHWGILAVFLAGFTPIPYKVFTISAGAMHMLFWPFVLASIGSRGVRFFLVSAAMFVGGARMQKILHRYVDVMGWAMIIILLLLSLLAIAGCDENYAPVTAAITSPSIVTNFHRVGRGETLYSIAWRYDMDYRRLAAINHLRPPYKLLAGQKLRLKAPHYTYHPTYTHISHTPIAHKRQVLHKGSQVKVIRVQNLSRQNLGPWRWPAQGKLIGGYDPTDGHKGINIAGKMDSPIVAAASGRVAYSGNGLRGYGNLIIIKHNSEYLSAYAHNSKNLVKEGQLVKAGEVIAYMGNSEAQAVMLHFEIRKAGTSVNPLRYLNK